jgi:hypothetical protein
VEGFRARRRSKSSWTIRPTPNNQRVEWHLPKLWWLQRYTVLRRVAMPLCAVLCCFTPYILMMAWISIQRPVLRVKTESLPMMLRAVAPLLFLRRCWEPAPSIPGREIVKMIEARLCIWLSHMLGFSYPTMLWHLLESATSWLLFGALAGIARSMFNEYPSLLFPR